MQASQIDIIGFSGARKSVEVFCYPRFAHDYIAFSSDHCIYGCKCGEPEVVVFTKNKHCATQLCLIDFDCVHNVILVTQKLLFAAHYIKPELARFKKKDGRKFDQAFFLG